jgi:hypothetical protein
MTEPTTEPCRTAPGSACEARSLEGPAAALHRRWRHRTRSRVHHDYGGGMRCWRSALPSPGHLPNGTARAARARVPWRRWYRGRLECRSPSGCGSAARRSGRAGGSARRATLSSRTQLCNVDHGAGSIASVRRRPVCVETHQIGAPHCVHTAIAALPLGIERWRRQNDASGPISPERLGVATAAPGVGTRCPRIVRPQCLGVNTLQRRLAAYVRG